MELDVLSKIWGDRSGYVFLPWIPGTARSKVQRKRGYKEGRAYHWPRDKGLIAEHIQAHTHDDLYFTPALFRGKRRVSEMVMEEDRLWADLDEKDPRECGDYKPTVAWQTSPGRYQAVWVLTEPAKEASVPNAENHRLTAYLGADISGWDTTQLLRVPGSRHHKASEEGVRGKLLWSDGPEYAPEHFADLPEVDGADEHYDLLDEELLGDIDRHEVWGRVRLKVSGKIRNWIELREIDDDSLDRSEILWQIERELADAGCSLAEIVVVVRATVWNKYAGRNDELKRLKVEAGKAIAERKDVLGDPEDEIEKPDELLDFSEFAGFKHAARPQWMVKDFVIAGGCGFIAAIPKSMKSWIGQDLAFSVSRGVPFFGTPVRKACNVLYIQQEDPMTLVKRNLTMIAEPKGMHWDGHVIKTRSGVRWEPPEERRYNMYPLVMEGFNGGDPGWLSWLEETVERREIGLVVMDTLATVAPGVDIDSATEVKEKLLDPLKTIGRKHNCTMLLVHHNTKAGTNSRAGQNMSGSGQIHAWADFGIYLGEKKVSRAGTDLRFQLESKLGGSATRSFRVFRFEDEGQWLPEEILMEDGGERRAAREVRPKGRAPKDYTELRGKIDQLKAKEPGITQMTIAERLGISQPQVSTVLRRTRDA